MLSDEEYNEDGEAPLKEILKENCNLWKNVLQTQSIRNYLTNK